MNSIGAMLRQERLRRGWDVAQVAERTKINASLLVAIESDDLEKLPGPFFVRSFVRQYARALGLDETGLEAELQRLTPVEPPPVAEAPPPREIELPNLSDGFVSRISGQRSLGSLAAFLVIVAACSVIYVAWQRTRETPRPAAHMEASQPPAPHPPAPVSATPPQPARPKPATDEPIAEKPLVAESAAAPPLQPLSSVPPGETAAIKVELHATAPAWIRVTADGGKVLFTGILQPDQGRIFESVRRLSIRTGNAGGLEASWNGKPIGALGPKGQIRVAEFTPEQYTVGPPAPPAFEPE